MNNSEIDYVELSEESMAFGRKRYGLCGEPESSNDISELIIACVIMLAVSVACSYYFGIEFILIGLIVLFGFFLILVMLIRDRRSRISFVLDRTGFHASLSWIFPRNTDKITLPLEEIMGFTIIEQKVGKLDYLFLYIQLRNDDYRTTYCTPKTDENRQRLELLIQPLHSILSQMQNREITIPKPPVQDEKKPSLLLNGHDIFSSNFVPVRKRQVIDETETNSSVTQFSCRGWTKVPDESGNTYAIKGCPHFLPWFLLILSFCLFFLTGSICTCPKFWFNQGCDPTFSVSTALFPILVIFTAGAFYILASLTLNARTQFEWRFHDQTLYDEFINWRGKRYIRHQISLDRCVAIDLIKKCRRPEPVTMEFVDINDEVLHCATLRGLTYEECRQIQLEFATECRRQKQKEDYNATEKQASGENSTSEQGLIRTLIRHCFMPEDGLLVILLFPVKLTLLVPENIKRFTSKKQLLCALSLALPAFIVWGMLFLLACTTTIYFLMKISIDPEIFQSIQVETREHMLFIAGIAATALACFFLFLSLPLLLLLNSIKQKNKPDKTSNKAPEQNQQ